MDWYVVQVEAGTPVTGRRVMTEAEWLQVVTGERDVADFEFALEREV